MRALMTLLCASWWTGFAIAGPQSVDRLLDTLTLQERIRLIHGELESPSRYQGQAGYLAGAPRLGIPALRFGDGPPGVLTRHRATALTSTLGLAATFSPKDAYLNGQIIGRDARALGVNVTLQPFINLMRDPTWARAYDLYGEDPLLVGMMGAGLIRGIQSQGVMAQAKHFIAYNGAMDVRVGEQALHEIYAEPFAYAVQAGVASIMCSYNKINGTYACGNPVTLQTLLRQELGFAGFVTSDWGAAHAATFVNAGLDLEMPGSMLPYLPCYFCSQPSPSQPLPPGGLPFAQSAYPIPEEPDIRVPLGGFRRMESARGMLAAIQDGRVAPARITAAARRILDQMERFGWLPAAERSRISAVPFSEDLPAVVRTAEDGAVLLKNQDHILPLTPRDLHSIAIIGPGAGQTVTIGQSGEKALGFPGRDMSPLSVLQQAARKVPGSHIVFAVADDMTGHPVPAALLQRIDREIDYTVAANDALPAGSNRTWRGALEIRQTGTYWMYLQLMGCKGKVKLDGQVRVRSGNLVLHGDVVQAAQDNVLPTTDNLDNVRVAVHLAAGLHSLEVDEEADGSGRPVQIRLSWLTPTERRQDFAAALKAAREAGTVVVFGWGRGRPAYALPGEQDRLISAIAAINPRTIVVLNTGQPDALPWLDKVRGLLEMWYPGDGGGVATADVLLGRCDPAGRLPFTWARQLTQYVSHDPAHPERSSAGVAGVTHFSEGILIGYRWFDQQGIDPLFPFGYGLSYTRFVYKGLGVTRAADGGLLVSFTLSNAGRVAGDEVPQVYLGAPAPAPAGVQFAPRALAGFDRVSLEAGRSVPVRIHVPLRQLQYWSVRDSAWRMGDGRRVVYVGASSRDVRLQRTIVIR